MADKDSAPQEASKPIVYPDADLSCGLSYNGHILCGSSEAIDDAKRWLHSHTDVVPVLRAELLEAREQLQASKEASKAVPVADEHGEVMKHRLMHKVDADWVPASEFLPGLPDKTWVAKAHESPNQWRIDYQRRWTGSQIANGIAKTLASQPEPTSKGEPDYSEMSREQLERHAARMAQTLADDRARKFYDKHAFGPMMPPSCLCCGKLPGKVAISHAELPGVVVCETCRNAALSAPQEASRTVLVADERETEYVECASSALGGSWLDGVKAARKAGMESFVRDRGIFAGIDRLIEQGSPSQPEPQGALPVAEKRSVPDTGSVSALRWLLNITTEFDRKDVSTRQAARLLDQFTDGLGRTNRERLESLWHWCQSLIEAERLRTGEVFPKQHPPEPEPASQQWALSDDTKRLDWLRENSCDLRCIDIPTGAGDADVHWVVIEHHMAKPHEREVGRSYNDEPREAIDMARAILAAASGSKGGGE